MTLNGRQEWLSTRQCAARISVSTGFVRGEIRDGRLRAKILRREGKRPVYRVTPEDFSVYVTKYWDRSATSAQSARSA